MANPVWIWINCYAGHEKEASEALRAAFAQAGIPDQLFDLILSPEDWSQEKPSGANGLDRTLAPNPAADPFKNLNFTNRIMAKVDRTAAAAMILRAGYEEQPLARWTFNRMVNRQSSASTTPAERRFKIRDRVRILSWPFEGFAGLVIHIDPKTGWLSVFIFNQVKAMVVVEPDQVAPDSGGEKPSRAWYVLYGYAGKETILRDRLLQRLNEAGLLERLYDIIVPAEGQEAITMLREGKVRTIYPSLYPGAVFVLVSLSPEVWEVLRQTPGLTGFVGVGNRPLPYTPAPMRSGETLPGEQSTAPAQKGELVRILSGPFRDFRGTVLELDPGRSRLRVMIEFHNHPTPVEIGYEQVARE